MTTLGITRFCMIFDLVLVCESSLREVVLLVKFLW